MKPNTFETWMRAVDNHVSTIAGVSVHDLPDCMFRDWYDDGCSPQDAAFDALEYAGWEC